MAILDDIACEVGVSRRTVASVLSGDHRPRYTAARKRAEHILRLADRMCYRPNAAAKAISTGRFGTVALVMSTHYERSNFTRGLVHGIHDALLDHNMHMSLFFLSDGQLDDPSRLPAFLAQQMVDGLLINYTHAIPQHMQDAIDSSDMPVAWVNVKRERGCIYPDDRDAGRRATQHLIDLGHHCIAYTDFTHGPRIRFLPHYSAEDRLAGYREHITAAGLPLEIIQSNTPQPDHKAALAQAQALLGRTDRPTAVVCHSPDEARVMELAAARSGLDVPGDLSIITFGRAHGDIRNWTLMAEPHETVGHTAITQLLNGMENPENKILSVPVNYRFHTGQTTSRNRK